MKKLKRNLPTFSRRCLKKCRTIFTAMFCSIAFMLLYSLPDVDISTHNNSSISCLDYDQRNKDLLSSTENKNYTPCRTNENKWTVFHEEKLTLIRKRWKAYIDTVDEYPLNKFNGRGIVTSTRKTIFPRFLASLLLIRWLNSTLPIEIFLFPNELNENQLVQLQNIEHVSIHIVNNRQSLQDRSMNRYAIKLYSIIQSKFEHILWLDADNIPIRDPEYLFDLPHYKNSTAIFWPDFWTSFQNNPIWQILNISCRAEDYEQEAGQVVINKRLSWKALHLAMYLNRDPDIMKIILGDKDTFRHSWRILNIPFYFIRKYLAIGGFYHRDVNRTGEKEFCGHTMIQHDPLDEILFLHANLVKYYPNIKFSRESKYPQFKHMSNPWRVYRRYLNSVSYLKASIYRKYGYSCTTFPTDGPPLCEDEFHRLVSPDITMTYLKFLEKATNTTDTSAYVSVVD